MNKKAKILGAVTIYAVSIASIVLSFGDVGNGWPILSLGIAVFAWQVQLGIFGKPVLSGYLLVENTVENQGRYRFSTAFNVFIWLALVVIAIQYGD